MSRDPFDTPNIVPLSRSDRDDQQASCFFPAAALGGRPVPERAWLVPDLLPLGTVTLLGGDGGTGKSLLALQLAVGVATGRGWIGRAVEQGRVIYLSAEDDGAELHRRLDAILRAERLGYPDLEGLLLRSLAGEDALLAFEAEHALMPSPLFKELDRQAEDERPSLITLDTLADLYPSNENDRSRVRQFVNLLRGLAIRHRCAVVLLAHPSLSGLNSGSGTSGSTAWSNSVRSRLYLKRLAEGGYEADPDRRVLELMKSNYARTGTELGIRWQSGVFVPEAQPEGLDAMAHHAKAERVFLKLLRLMQAQGRRVNDSGGNTYAPKLFAAHPEAEGVARKAFAQAMDRLLSEGRIRNVEYGPPSRRRRYLEVAE